jgi:hypothetical protein
MDGDGLGYGWADALIVPAPMMATAASISPKNSLFMNSPLGF